MTLVEATSLVRTQGFNVIPQVPHFAQEDDYACYLYRKGQYHEYMLLVSHDNAFLEGVYERYLASKDTRRPKGRDTQKKDDPYTEYQRKGFIPVYATIVRGSDISSL